MLLDLQAVDDGSNHSIDRTFELVAVDRVRFGPSGRDVELQLRGVLRQQDGDAVAHRPSDPQLEVDVGIAAGQVGQVHIGRPSLAVHRTVDRAREVLVLLDDEIDRQPELAADPLGDHLVKEALDLVRIGPGWHRNPSPTPASPRRCGEDRRNSPGRTRAHPSDRTRFAVGCRQRARRPHPGVRSGPPRSGPGRKSLLPAPLPLLRLNCTSTARPLRGGPHIGDEEQRRNDHDGTEGRPTADDGRMAGLRRRPLAGRRRRPRLHPAQLHPLRRATPPSWPARRRAPRRSGRS